MEAWVGLIIVSIGCIVFAALAKGYRTNFHAEVDAHIQTCQNFESYVVTSESATTSLNAVYLHDMQYLTDTLHAERWYATEQALRIVQLQENIDLFWKMALLSFGDIVLADQHARAQETIETYELDVVPTKPKRETSWHLDPADDEILAEQIENPMVVDC